MNFWAKRKINKNFAYQNNSIGGYSWLCMDIGTENMKARYINNGASFDEPSYLAEDYEKEIIYYGDEAKNLIDKTNNKVVVKRPIRDGNIADPKTLEKILSRIFRRIKVESIERKRLIVLMATPSEINPVQKKALENIVETLGAYRGYIQEEVKMAALGSGQDIFGTSIMCIDMGGGSTDIAIINKDSILYSYTTNCAGDFLSEEIKDYLLKTKKVLVGLKEAEDMKKKIGSLMICEDEKPYKITGLLIPDSDSIPGEKLSISKTIEITPQELREQVLQPAFRKYVIPAIRKVLRTVGTIAPGSLSDLKRKGKGIVVSGGGAYIRKISEFIEEELKKEYYVDVKDENEKIISHQKYEGDNFEVKCSLNPLFDVINGCVKYRDEILRELNKEKHKTYSKNQSKIRYIS